MIAMMMSATMINKPTTAVLFRRNRRTRSCRLVSLLDSASVGVSSAIGRSVAVSSSFSVIRACLAQPNSGVENRDHDVGKNRAAQHADPSKRGGGNRPIDILLGDRRHGVFTHAVER